MNAARCEAHSKRTGLQCGAMALRGSDPPRCRNHLGKPKAQFIAERDLKEKATKALAKLGEPEPVEDPLSELLLLAGKAKTWLAIVEAQVEALKGDYRYRLDSGEQLRAEVGLLERAMAGYGKILVDVGRLDIDQRLARIGDEQQARLLAMLRMILVELGVDVTGERLPGMVLRAAQATAPKRLAR